MRNDKDLALALLADCDGVTQVTDAAFHFDLAAQKIFKCGYIENLVCSRLGSIYNELMRNFSQCYPNITKGGDKRE